MELKCSICLDNLFFVNNDVSVTQCGHIYHKDCLEASTKTYKKCPNCNTEITNVIKKIHPDVYDELNYSSCSNETTEFLSEFFNNEREIKIILLKVIKKLDKDNTSLKEAKKKYEDNLKTAKVFLNSFKKHCKDLQEKTKSLKLKNSNLLAEVLKMNDDKKNNNISPKKNVYTLSEKKIKAESSNDSFSNIETSSSKGSLYLNSFILD